MCIQDSIIADEQDDRGQHTVRPAKGRLNAWVIPTTHLKPFIKNTLNRRIVAELRREQGKWNVVSQLFRAWQDKAKL